MTVFNQFDNMTYVAENRFMLAAISEAVSAQTRGDYAIGAVVVRNNEIIAASGNRIKQDTDPTQHAEVAALRFACRKLNTRHLEGCVLYTTHEPCPMCASAAIWARLAGVVSGGTIADMASFCSQYGNQDWSWRTISMPAKSVLAVGDPKLFLIEQFMRKECLQLFHSS